MRRMDAYEREPEWFPLIAGSAAPTRLLSLRYKEVICLKFSKPSLVALKYAG